jgi:hypothetical protein
MTQVPREWGDARVFSDEALLFADVNVPQMTIDYLRQSFEKAKVDNNWPDHAKPTWVIRWTYLTMADSDD